MNDPWLPLIDALSGKRTSTPSNWPVRRVHRIEGYVPDAVLLARRHAEVKAFKLARSAPVAR